MLDNEEFDVFIAYHGDSETGSEKKAREIYRYIHGAEIYKGRTINAYFHPESNKQGRFDDTPIIVSRTPMFLFVVNSNVSRDKHGSLNRKRDDGKLRNIYEEVRIFHSSMFRETGGETAASVFIADDMDFKVAEKLHPMFLGKSVITTLPDVLDWVTDFYKDVYINRLVESYKELYYVDFEAFKAGVWVPEAEEIFEGLRNEKLGRSLLIYYIEKAKLGDEGSKIRIKDIIGRLSSLYNIKQSTKNLISIGSKYI